MSSYNQNDRDHQLVHFAVHTSKSFFESDAGKQVITGAVSTALTVTTAVLPVIVPIAVVSASAWGLYELMKRI